MSDPSAKNIQIAEGDLLDLPVEVIVNAWNRNIIPWWLLLPQGVSGGIDELQRVDFFGKIFVARFAKKRVLG